MTMEQLRSFYWAEPFQPFLLKLKDGRELPVHRPEYIAMSPAGLVVVALLDDSVVYTDLEAVQGIERLSEPAQSTV